MQEWHAEEGGSWESSVSQGFHLKTNDLWFKNDVFLLAKTIQPM
jgi:hypothetical protein